MKRILIPVDFSECSQLAAAYAASIARRTSGEIMLLHVLDVEEPDPGLGSTGSWAGSEAVSTVPYVIGRMKRVKKQMEEFISENGLEGIPVHDFIEMGEPGTKINEGAEKHDADIIIMGTHGSSGFNEFIIGSVAEKVSQHATRPVITIRENANANPKNIVFASDFSSESEAVFEKVKEFAYLFKSRITLVKVIDKAADKIRNESLHDLHSFADAHGLDHSDCAVWPASKTEEGILLFAKQQNADLIAVGTHGRGGLSRFFNSSLAAELVNHSFSPVLTINIRKK